MRAEIDPVAAEGEPPALVHREVAGRGAAPAAPDRHHEEERVHAVTPRRRQRPERVRPAPHGVGVEHQHRPLRREERQGVAEPAAGIQHLGRLAHRGHAAPGEMRLQRLGPVVGVGHAPFDPGLVGQRQRVVDQRAARDLDHGLGAVRGERPHARSEARGEEHQGRGHAGRSGRSTRARSLASAGWSSAAASCPRTRGAWSR